MSDERDGRRRLCAALAWLRDEFEGEGRGAELHAATQAVLAETPVRQVIARLGLAEHELDDEAATVRGGEPWDMIPVPSPRSAGEIYRCPDGWCSLDRPREPGGPLPSEGRCWLRDRPLRIVEA
ncbi:hypothetical protein ACH4HG_40920 [Streptomyces coeruleorubidus]|uniref:hypothetical protein n=1 Tax=Streptomyces coeruleorubidus TaxID=116188 RepID=UPI001875C24B|nr:hypothetical protein [Streptomyces bellus]GGU43659.1 hypothetical protein GCM10010244_82170 [Streptomyces bellus]